jgi:2-polyprenyl-6-hydroxyphenyl methylase/3-demethylubiquinone-9 3-methyltransferase
MSTASASEIVKFNGFARSYWDPEGPMRMLHLMNPLRIDFAEAHTLLQDARVLDVGCGGGLAAEAMTRRGAEVTGLDASPQMLQAARLHAEESGLKIQYELGTADAFAPLHPGAFDLITAFEMIEHVPDPEATLQAMSHMLAPGGVLIVSTLNRSAKAYLGAIVFAEYIAQWVPKGTHDYHRFLRPSELAGYARNAGLHPAKFEGLTWHPLYRQFQRTPQDLSINYLFAARKPT